MTRRFDARYGQLEDEFFEWAESCCEHEDGDYCSESVSNIAGCAQFSYLVEEAGGEAEFPLLSKLLPQGNGGLYPAEQAPATLAELDRFITKVQDVEEWVLLDAETDEEIWTSTEGGSFPLLMAPSEEVWMVGGKICFYLAGHDPVETTHFKRIPFQVKTGVNVGAPKTDVSPPKAITGLRESCVSTRVPRPRPLIPSAKRAPPKPSVSST